MSLRSWGFKSPLAHHHLLALAAGIWPICKRTTPSKELAPGGAESGGRRRSCPSPSSGCSSSLAAIVVIVVVVIVVVASAMQQRRSGRLPEIHDRRSPTSSSSPTRSAPSSPSCSPTPATPTARTSRPGSTQFVAKSESSRTQAKELEVPKDLVEAERPPVLRADDELPRRRAWSNLKPSLMNALEVQDTEVAVGADLARPQLPDATPTSSTTRCSCQGPRTSSRRRTSRASPSPATQFLDRSRPGLQVPGAGDARRSSRAPATSRPCTGWRRSRWWPCPTRRRSRRRDVQPHWRQRPTHLPGDRREPGQHVGEGRPGGGHPRLQAADDRSKSRSTSPRSSPRRSSPSTVKGINPTPYGEKSPPHGGGRAGHGREVHRTTTRSKPYVIFKL